MITLTIRHTTTYRYRLPVWLGAHRLMLRPRESRELRLVSSEVTTTPAASLSWRTTFSATPSRRGPFKAWPLT